MLPPKEAKELLYRMFAENFVALTVSVYSEIWIESTPWDQKNVFLLTITKI